MIIEHEVQQNYLHDRISDVVVSQLFKFGNDENL